MKTTYKAVEVSAPGNFRVVERQVSEPGAGQVWIRVEACGICHTDAATVMGIYPGLTLPRVPGHEVVGRIEALGSGVSRWKIGQRVRRKIAINAIYTENCTFFETNEEIVGRDALNAKVE